MNQSEIADRLQNMFVSTAMLPERRVELAAILRDLRAADEKATRLPAAITNDLIIKSPFGLMIRGFNGAGFDARLGDVLTDIRDTPELAIDALAAALEKEN